MHNIRCFLLEGGKGSFWHCPLQSRGDEGQKQLNQETVNIRTEEKMTMMAILLAELCPPKGQYEVLICKPKEDLIWIHGLYRDQLK